MMAWGVVNFIELLNCRQNTAHTFSIKLFNNDINLLKPTGYVMHHQFNPLNTKRKPLYLKIQFIPRSKHFSYRL